MCAEELACASKELCRVCMILQCMLDSLYASKNCHRSTTDKKDANMHCTGRSGLHSPHPIHFSAITQACHSRTTSKQKYSPTNSGVPKMFLNSLPKSILCANPKSMILIRGFGTFLSSSIMFSGFGRKAMIWEEK